MIIFNQLTLKGKYDLLTTRGIRLSSLERKDITVELFYLDGFFVDVFFERSSDLLLHIRTFTSVKRLYKYKLSQEELVKRFFSYNLE